MFSPRYQISNETAKALMDVESCRSELEGLAMNAVVLAGLRHTARLSATHFSTQIEGNRLTLEQVQTVVLSEEPPVFERRDETEVRNYYRALAEMERLSAEPPIREESVASLHGLVMDGRASPTPYRGAQNVVWDSGSGKIAYMQQEAHDVPHLMTGMFQWLEENIRTNTMPAPVLAALAHYQYATIHPYYDGNGRTARLFATLILHKTGYGLKGVYALEEHYARNLGAYYHALSLGPSHNYYFGRAEADLSPFVDYFCVGMAAACAKVVRHAKEATQLSMPDDEQRLRKLDPRQRKLVSLFYVHAAASSVEIAAHLGLSPRTVSALCKDWVADGFLAHHDASRKNRLYRLGPDYERLVPTK